MSEQRGKSKFPNDVIEFTSPKTVSQQAAEWVAILDGAEPSEDTIKAFRKWIHASEEHRIAFSEMAEFWEDMNSLTQIVLPREIDKDLPNVKNERKSFWLNSLGYATACSALLLSVFLYLMFQSSEKPLTYATAVGESMTVVLPDGSKMFLNTNSVVSIKYSEQVRGISLQQGEAHFDVESDKARPFEVSAKAGLVRAIGTAFSVHLRGDNVEVLVSEGLVEIAPQPGDASSNGSADEAQLIHLADKETGQVRLKAGTSAVFDSANPEEILLTEEDNVEEKLSWLQGVLVFEKESLASVVDEVSRYTPLKIIIPEKNARELRIGGVFKIGDTQSLFEALEEGFDIHTKYVTENVVYLISSENI